MEKVKISLKSLITYQTFIIIGVLMTVGTLLKLFGIIDFSSDWFWFMAGVGLVIEGSVYYVNQKRFEQKYKVVDRFGQEV